MYLPYLKNPQPYDNVKFYIRPLECHLRSSHVKGKNKGWNEEKFREWCVDFERGDPKPQIRIHNNHTLFNITNLMQFENIQFTAEDAMARVNETWSLYGQIPD